MPDQPPRDPTPEAFDPTPGRETPVESAAETAVAVSEVIIRERSGQTEQRTEAAVERRIRPLTALLLAMMAISLVLHAVTLSRLLGVRNTLRSEIERLAGSVESAKSETIKYDLPINQVIPINVVIPINESVVIPINTTVDINQTINIPIDTGVVGVINLPVPLDVSIPINTSVPIEFNEEVPISTTFTVNITVPLELDMNSPQISEYLDRLQKALLDLRDEF